MIARLLLCIAALAMLAACASAPGAFTVGQSTVVLNPPENAVTRYLLDVHEAIHRSQFRKQGVSRFLWDYVVRPSRRFSLEAEAYTGALCQLQALGGSETRRAATYAKAAKHLRGYALGGHARHEVAQSYIDRVYRQGHGCEALLTAHTGLPLPSSKVMALIRPPTPSPGKIELLMVAGVVDGGLISSGLPTTRSPSSRPSPGAPRR